MTLLQTVTVQANATALSVSSGGHPNKTPFSGTLVFLDQVSNSAAAGAHGRKIIVTTEAAKRGLSSLLGMSVSYEKTKIGVIMAAEIPTGTNALLISGHLFASDFPDDVRAIKAMRSDLGFSFEAQRLSTDPCTGDVLTIRALTFTGAAILLKSRAAYTMTSLAASSAARAPFNVPVRGRARALHTQETRSMSHNYTNAHPERSSLKPFRYNFNDPNSLIATLDAIGFEPPQAVRALAASGQKLGSGGKFINEYELDAVLAGYDVSIQKRMQLKSMLTRQGLL